MHNVDLQTWWTLNLIKRLTTEGCNVCLCALKNKAVACRECAPCCIRLNMTYSTFDKRSLTVCPVQCFKANSLEAIAIRLEAIASRLQFVQFSVSKQAYKFLTGSRDLSTKTLRLPRQYLRTSCLLLARPQALRAAFIPLWHQTVAREAFSGSCNFMPLRRSCNT